MPLYLVVFLFIDQLNNLTMVTSIGRAAALIFGKLIYYKN